MPVGKYAGKPVDQLPLSYLRWMILQDFPPELLDAAKRKVESSQFHNDHVGVSRHALDMFSLRFLTRWVEFNRPLKLQDRLGLSTYVAKLAQAAWDTGVDVSKHRHQDDGVVKEMDGIRFVYDQSPHFPEYREVITVIDPR
jgi:hypothetical protein